jgi:hypothetical protein
VNRKWLVGGILAALVLAGALALVIGGIVGRSIVPSAPAPSPSRPELVPFRDTLTDLSISHPASWVRRAPTDQAVRFVASSPDESAGVRVSVRKTDLEPVTKETLPAVRPLTDDLLRADTRITAISEPAAVELGGLPGYRYRYTYRTRDGDGAHVHYFLFKPQRLVQVVLQAVPASRLPRLEPTFDRIASSFEGNRG